MKAVCTPRSNVYIIPKEFPPSRLHYAVVQVSERRYVVAEYSGATQPANNGVPVFQVVTDTMTYLEAEQKAIELTAARTS